MDVRKFFQVGGALMIVTTDNITGLHKSIRQFLL